MTATTLRTAADSITTRAAEMRAAFPDSSEPAFLEAVAEWLKSEGDYRDGYEARFGDKEAWPRFEEHRFAHAFATARAWLKEDS